jgi:hypothetical protein
LMMSFLAFSMPALMSLTSCRQHSAAAQHSNHPKLGA